MGQMISEVRWTSAVQWVAQSVAVSLALAASAVLGSAGSAHADEAPVSVIGSVKLPAGVSSDRIIVNVLEPQLGSYPGTVALEVAASTSLAADGSYRFDGLLPAGPLGRQIEVVDSKGRLYARAWGNADAWGQPRRSVVVGAEPVLDLGQVEMVRTASAQGRLVSSIPGESVAGAVVEASVFTCVNKCYFIPVATDVVSADGSFYLAGLPGGTSADPARFTVTVSDPDGRFEEYSIGTTTPFMTVVDGRTKELGRITVTSKGTGPVAAVLTMSKAPKVVGTAKVGRTLRASKGTWPSSVGAKTTVKVQWQTKKGKKAVSVKGATASKLKLTKKFRGKQVRLKVTVTAPGHADVVRTTSWSTKVR